MNVGDVLKRRSGGGSIKLVGVDGAGRWVAVDAEQHGAPFAVESAELVRDFQGVKDPTPPRGPSDEDLRRADVAANDAAVRAYGRANAARERRDERPFAERAARAGGATDLRSPEERLAAAAEEADGGDGTAA